MKRRHLIGAGAGLGAAGAIGIAVYGAQYPTAQIYGSTICRNPAAGRRIALTYDDGPNPTYTPRLLEILGRFDAKATFFSIGMWAEREPGLLREMHEAGHAIGNHTHTHPTMPLLSGKAVKEELRRCRAAVEASGVEFSRSGGGMLMRPPYGRRRPGTLRAMREEGYEPVTWSVTCYDWRRTATQRSIARHAADAGEGDIILMHDGNNLEPAADRSRSVAATEDTLNRYAAEGYEFVTVPDLMSA
jgi:peptidoglycan/xylan/chitin deacetylase (PgdA/CDA1 family)